MIQSKSELRVSYHVSSRLQCYALPDDPKGYRWCVRLHIGDETEIDVVIGYEPTQELAELEAISAHQRIELLRGISRDSRNPLD